MRRRRDDDDEVIRDGETLRVPLMLRDGELMELPIWQRDALLSMRYRMSDAEMAKHRPGYRFADKAGSRAKMDAYNASVREMCDAWRPMLARNHADNSPVINAPSTATPGHLDHRLQCIPDRREDAAPPASPPRFMDADEAWRIRSRAYDAMVDEMTNAWRAK